MRNDKGSEKSVSSESINSVISMLADKGDKLRISNTA